MYLIADGKKHKISNWSGYLALLKEGALGYRWVSDHFVSLLPNGPTASASQVLVLNDKVATSSFGSSVTPTPNPTPTATGTPTPTPTTTPKPTATPTPTTQPPSGFLTYTVVSGDTLSRIATRYSVTVSAILTANGLTNPNYIYVGQVLRIPSQSAAAATPNPTSTATKPATPKPSATQSASPTASTRTYTVVAGDSLWSIAVKFGVTVASLQVANQITNPNLLRIGQVLVIS
jgi:lysozyme